MADLTIRVDSTPVTVHLGPAPDAILDAAALAAIASIPTVEDFEDIQAAVDALTADPENAVTKIPIAVKLLDPISTATATWVTGASASRSPYWNMPAAGLSYLAFQLEVPSHFATAYFDIYFWNLASVAGNVVFNVGVHNHTEGDSINTSPSGLEVGATGAANATQWLDTKIRVGPITVDPAKRTTVRLYRNGDSGSDTLSNAVAFYHLDVVKAS